MFFVHLELEPGEKKCLAKESEEEPSSAITDAVGFEVKYLGSTIVTNTATVEAVDTILTMVSLQFFKVSVKYQETKGNL